MPASPEQQATDTQAISTGGSSDGHRDDLPTRSDTANAGIRREPQLPEQEEIVPPQRSPREEFEFHERDDDKDAARARAMKRMRRAARQAALDPDDGVEL